MKNQTNLWLPKWPWSWTTGWSSEDPHELTLETEPDPDPNPTTPGWTWSVPEEIDGRGRGWLSESKPENPEEDPPGPKSLLARGEFLDKTPSKLLGLSLDLVLQMVLIGDLDGLRLVASGFCWSFTAFCCCCCCCLFLLDFLPHQAGIFSCWFLSKQHRQIERERERERLRESKLGCGDWEGYLYGKGRRFRYEWIKREREIEEEEGRNELQWETAKTRKRRERKRETLRTAGGGWIMRRKWRGYFLVREEWETLFRQRECLNCANVWRVGTLLET